MTPLYDIAREAADRFNMPAAVLFSKSKRFEYQRVKTLFCQLAKREGYVEREIGEYLRLDRSTVNHHLNKKEYVI